MCWLIGFTPQHYSYTKGYYDGCQSIVKRTHWSSYLASKNEFDEIFFNAYRT